MAGPTGMGMAKLIHDNSNADVASEKYGFEKFTDTKMALASLTAGNTDVICLPTTDAANYYNNQGKDTVVLAINTLNTLFVLTDKSTDITSIDDLNGQTVYTCKNGTPKIILEYLLEKAGVDAAVSTSVEGKEILTPAQLGEMIVGGKVKIAVVPEPIVTSSLLTIKKNGNKDIEYSVDLSLDGVWKSECGGELAMGCIVAKKSFVEAHPSVIDAFLKEYRSSIEFISNENNIDTAASYVVEAGVMQAEPAAKSALSNLSKFISYIDGHEMKSILIDFYTATKTTLPENDFYYAG
jgi:NitT/TauT family transport system substrate-binding protein